MIPEPNGDDMARSLILDYEMATGHGAFFRNQSIAGWPVAIRRAHHAEALLVSERERYRQETVAMQDVIRGLTDRVAAQNELLTRRAEVPAPPVE